MTRFETVGGDIGPFFNVPKPLKDGFHYAHQTLGTGTCLEFGVAWGTSYAWQVSQILDKYIGSKLIGFDSWAGLPKETPGVWAPDRHHAGAFSTSKADMVQRVTELGISIGSTPASQFSLVDGFFKDSLTIELRDQIKDLIFVNIDVDIHSSTVEVLNWITPLLRPGVVLYADDWLDPVDIGKGAAEWGEHLAWRQWTEAHPHIKYNMIAVNAVNQRAFEILAV